MKKIIPKSKRSRIGLVVLIVLLIAAAAIFIGSTSFGFNKVKDIGQIHNIQRRIDVTLILDALSEYSSDKNEAFNQITVVPTEICRTDIVVSCSGLVDLSVLIKGKQYLANMPVDPNSPSSNSTGYAIARTVNGKIVVSAPYAEGDTSISVMW